MEDRPLTDEELIAGAKRGEVAAYEDLVRRYEDVSFRMAYLVLGDADEARDATQEAFISAWRALPGFRDGAPPRPWLLKIVGNAARNRRRRSTRQLTLALRAERDPSGEDRAPSAEATVLSRLERDELWRALSALEPRDRTILGMRWLLDLSEREMSAALGIPGGTVKSRLSRAMKRLRALMPPEEGSHG